MTTSGRPHQATKLDDYGETISSHKARRHRRDQIKPQSLTEQKDHIEPQNSTTPVNLRQATKPADHRKTNVGHKAKEQQHNGLPNLTTNTLPGAGMTDEQGREGEREGGRERRKKKRRKNQRRKEKRG